MSTHEGKEAATEEPREVLRNFCAVGFRSDIDATALVLGRSPSEIRSMMDGDLPVDDDLEMKIRGIAQERDFRL